MTPWLDDGDVRLYAGDALEQLERMPSESVQCIVTSPPFWGLRDYSCEGQIGLEETPDQWCTRLVAVFREARRVLRNDGVCWIEVGDTYSAANGYRNTGPGEGSERAFRSQTDYTHRDLSGCKPKDLVGAPWLLAFALRADGWYLRSDTIWARPNPMPESVTDRPTKAHSFVFLLSKQARYFYDADAIREPHVVELHAPGNRKPLDASRSDGDRVGTGGRKGGEAWGHSAGRNARSVWSIPTEPTPFAHFATFPTALVERCIKAGTSEHGACSECGAPWRRITERETNGERHVSPKDVASFEARGNTSDASFATSGLHGQYLDTRRETLGWEPSCACVVLTPRPADTVPCRVLDMFMGSGTTALVARRLGRHAIGIELNAEYLRIAAERLQQPTLWSTPA